MSATNDSPRGTRVVVILAVALIMTCSWLPGIERLANEQIEAGLKRALISFATARALNAAISVVQGTEVAFQPLGFGVTLAPGQIPDPVNDLVEQFSSLMLTASVAFGIQRVLLSIGSHWLVSLVVTLFTVIWATLFFLQRCPEWLSRVLVVLLMVRFAIPVAIIGSDIAFQHFMEKEYQASKRSIDATTAEVTKLTAKKASLPENLTPTKPPENQGMIDILKAIAGQAAGIIDKLKEKVAAQAAEWEARVPQLEQKAEQAIEDMVKLIAIFLMQTLVIPLLFIWMLYRLAGGVFRPSYAAMEELIMPRTRKTRQDKTRQEVTSRDSHYSLSWYRRHIEVEKTMACAHGSASALYQCFACRCDSVGIRNVPSVLWPFCAGVRKFHWSDIKGSY